MTSPFPADPLQNSPLPGPVSDRARPRLSSTARALALIVLAGALAIVAQAGSAVENPILAGPADWPQITLTLAAQGIFSPSAMAFPPDGSGRLFIAGTNGRIWFLREGDPTPHEFVNINHRGQGCRVFGLAFSPDYAGDGSFYVHCLDRDTGQVVVARYQVLPGDPDHASPDSRQEVLRVTQTAVMHSGGQLAFGPDGYLYVAVGDGDFNDDPENDAQNTANMLGKILRIDVQRALPNDPPPASGARPAVAWLPLIASGRGFTYTVPAGNPFVGAPGKTPEIWAYGLRNPWRFAFDRQTGDLYIGDVGQNRREEIDFQPAAAPGGVNYGWRVMEGSLCFNPANCNPSPFTPPVVEYSHGSGDCAVIGGEVYRGPSPAMQGIYLYGDHCTGRIWGLRRAGSTWQSQQLYQANFRLSDIGDDAAGNLYMADFDGGRIYRVVVQ